VKTWGSEGIAPPSLTLALDRDEWFDPCPGYFTLWEGAPRYSLDRRLGKPKNESGHCGEKKSLLPVPGIEPGQSSP
jgi:hypothetical protein